MSTEQNGGTSRRSVLTAGLLVAAGTPLLSSLATGTAHATGANDRFESNTDLYRHFQGTADTADGEGYDFARRYRRHELLDSEKATTGPSALTTILAIHGGGIEIGTSELCLGVAGYNPDPTPKPEDGPLLFPGEPLYDYWMFEGMRSSGQTYPDGSPKTNGELHVTSIHCDDHVALSMTAGSLNTVSLHGCTWENANPGKVWSGQNREGVVIGGRSTALRQRLTHHLSPHFAIFPGDGDVDGTATANICNRTMLGEGAQLELTTELRKSLFVDSSSASKRAETWNARFRLFAAACRSAIADVEATQRAARLL
ncbi:poly-gamma-glutamate hydrolase family protein [Streptomyces sp. NPDC093600]|uniref:poly-gamma-glutamate hydrolase family protein n=1 Tax=Streptomyces sp. NPDC093600 TaxID=3366047 RepID=UPI00380D8733